MPSPEPAPRLAPGEPAVLDLNGCARCRGEGHPGLRFDPLAHPIEIGPLVLTHWAPCPANGEPVLLAEVDLPRGRA